SYVGIVDDFSLLFRNNKDLISFSLRRLFSLLTSEEAKQLFAAIEQYCVNISSLTIVSCGRFCLVDIAALIANRPKINHLEVDPSCSRSVTFSVKDNGVRHFSLVDCFVTVDAMNACFSQRMNL